MQFGLIILGGLLVIPYFVVYKFLSKQLFNRKKYSCFLCGYEFDDATKTNNITIGDFKSYPQNFQ